MNKFDPQTYEISTRRVTEDGETLFKGTVKELPDVAVYESSPDAAYDAVVCVIAELQKQAAEQKREFPAPSASDDEFSGRVTLRMPKTLHRQISSCASREGVSLNHLITTVIASYVSAPHFIGARTSPLHNLSDWTGWKDYMWGAHRLFHGRQTCVTEELPVSGLDSWDPHDDLFTGRLRKLEPLNLVKITQPRSLPYPSIEIPIER
jgi:predicted HicB family RNase H-like nuclease